jgi:hypothetical protein
LPPQILAASWPYPPHQPKICDALRHALKFDPDAFVAAGTDAAFA